MHRMQRRHPTTSEAEWYKAYVALYVHMRRDELSASRSVTKIFSMISSLALIGQRSKLVINQSTVLIRHHIVRPSSHEKEIGY